jgi:hypothetical protein
VGDTLARRGEHGWDCLRSAHPRKRVRFPRGAHAKRDRVVKVNKYKNDAGEVVYGELPPDASFAQCRVNVARPRPS